LQEAVQLLRWYVRHAHADDPFELCLELYIRHADAFICPLGRSKVDYDNVLADSEREAVADLLNYLENVRAASLHISHRLPSLDELG
jgi:hypothetical protein